LVKILIVDDSATARVALRTALEREVDLHVVGEAVDGRGALRLIERLQPSLVTMDVHLRREDGIDLTARIMKVAPRPILIVTGLDPTDARLGYRAMEAGALDVVSKLPAPGTSRYEEKRDELARLARSLSRVPVVTRRPAERATQGPGAATPASGALVETGHPEVVVIGASTGGPPVVSSILAALPAPTPVPVAVVQHIARGFAPSFSSWLKETASCEVVTVERPLDLQPGRVYVAPDDRHLVISSRGSIGPSDAPPDGFQKPSVNLLFESAARCFGSRTLGILLTGMGTDGVRGFAALHHVGAQTIAQDPETCVVDSMPRNAILAGVAGQTLEPDKIGAVLSRLGSRPRGGGPR